MMRRKSSRSTLSILAAGALASAALVGCGSSSSKSTSASPTTTGSSLQSTGIVSAAGEAAYAKEVQLPTKLPVTQVLPRTPPAGVKIAFLNVGVPITASLLSGMQAAAKVLNWNVVNLPINQSNPASFSSAISTAISAGVKYIAFGSQPVSAYTPQLAAIRKAGIKIIDFGSSNPAIPGLLQPVLGTGTNEGSAADAAQALLVNAASKKVIAHVGEVNIPIYASAMSIVHGGIVKTLAAQCPKCTVSPIDISASVFASGNYAPTIVSYLQAHRQINYLFFDADLLDNGVVAQLHSVGMARPGMFGNEPYPPELTAIAAGQQDAWGGYPSLVFGWVLMDVAARLSVNADANIWNNSPPLVYTINKANVAAYVSDHEAVPLGYPAMFTTMWKK